MVDVSQEITESVGALLADEPGRIREIEFAGRSLFELYRVELEDGRRLAAKIVASPEMARTEQDGLQALAGAGAPTPHCYGHCGRVLLLEFLEMEAGRTKVEGFEADLLALYQHEPPQPCAGFGWHETNFIGSLRQPNRWHNNFVDFFWNERLLAQFRPAHERGLLNTRTGLELEQVLRRCATDWGLDQARPRLIHGDLWGGNLLPGAGGRLFLIDPSVACSHPEQDLAMLALFGNPLGPGGLESIARQAGLGPGFADRVAFWQLYPLLVHVNIFGASYVGQLQQALAVYR